MYIESACLIKDKYPFHQSLSKFPRKQSLTINSLPSFPYPSPSPPSPHQPSPLPHSTQPPFLIHPTPLLCPLPSSLNGNVSIIVTQDHFAGNPCYWICHYLSPCCGRCGNSICLTAQLNNTRKRRSQHDRGIGSACTNCTSIRPRHLQYLSWPWKEIECVVLNIFPPAKGVCV